MRDESILDFQKGGSTAEKRAVSFNPFPASHQLDQTKCVEKIQRVKAPKAVHTSEHSSLQ